MVAAIAKPISLTCKTKSWLWKRIWEIQGAEIIRVNKTKTLILNCKIKDVFKKLCSLSGLDSISGRNEDNDEPIPISDKSETNIIKEVNSEKKTTSAKD